MKKLIILALMAFASIDASAQFFTGLAFDVNWAKDGSKTTDGRDIMTNNGYSGTISPQFGYQFSPKFMVGGRVNFIFDKTYFYDTVDNAQQSQKYVTASIGWDIAPFCRYKLIELGKNGWFSIWADLHMYFGRMYPRSVEESGTIVKDFRRKYIYGIQGMPALGFRINEKSTLFVNVAILSLAYSGSYVDYNDGSAEYENNLILFTGKISGLVNAITSEGMYGIKLGMIRTF